MTKLTTHQRKARDYVQRENWDAALAEMKSIVAADSSNPSLHNQMGDIYLRKEDVVQACHHFEMAIDLYAGVGLHNNAVALCRKVLRLSPTRLEVRYRLARLRFEQGLRAEAAASFADYLDHARATGEEGVRLLEERCRDILERFPEDAPVGKILEKLEETRAFPAAFEIVQRLAQRAADAGDDVAARRYTEKMRSLRVLVGNRGGGDLHEPPPARNDAADTPAAATVPQPRVPQFVLEPGRVDLPGAAPRLPAEPDAAPRPPATSDEPVESLFGPRAAAAPFEAQESGDAASDAASGPTADADHGGEVEATEFVLETTRGDYGIDTADSDLVLDTAGPEQAATEPETGEQSTELELEIESSLPPEFFAGGGAAGAAAAPDSAEIREYELPEVSLADVEALLHEEESKGAQRAPAAEPPPAVVAPEPPPAAFADLAPVEDVGPAPGAAAARARAPLPAEPAHSPFAAATPLPPAVAAEPPAVAGRAPELRQPVWIPEDMMDDAFAGEPYAGRFHALEEVIDTFREQMARALGADASARYDLGVAYYEMGLYHEALAEFEAALPDAALRERCLEMMAACLAMQGRHAEIVDLLAPVLLTPGAAGLGPGLLYSMGVACEALGRREEARRHFEAVALVDSGFRDVQARLQRY